MSRWLPTLLIFALLAPAQARPRLPDWAEPLAAIQPVGLDPEDAEAVCLLDYREISLARNLVETRQVRRAVRILTGRGVRHGREVIYLGPEDRVRNLRAWLVRPSGRVEKLRGQDVAETQLLDERLYSDHRQVLLELPGVTEGCFVCFEYELQRSHTYPFLEEWIQQEIPVEQSELLLRLPKGMSHRCHPYRIGSAQPSMAGGAVRYHWSHLPGLPDEKLRPAVPDLLSRVILSFQGGRSPRAPVGNFGSWAEVAGWCRELTAPALGSSPSVGDRAGQICAGIEPPEEQVRRICDWVRSRIRYVAIHFDLGGLIPHSPEEVLRCEYGDCKDQAFLAAELLKSRSIQAWPVLTRTAGEGTIDPELPSPHRFNHCILAYQLPGSDLRFFDPTHSWVGYPYLPQSQIGTWGLLIGHPEQDLVRLESSRPPERSLEIEARMDSDGSVTARVEESWSPRLAEILRAGLGALSQEDREKEWQQLLARELPEVHLRSLTVEGLEEPDQDLVLRYEMEAGGLARSMGNRWLLSPLKLRRFPPPRLRDEERRLPVDLRNLAVHHRLNVSWELPAELIPEEDLSDSLESRFGGFRLESSRTEGGVELRLETRILEGRYPPGTYSEVRSFLQALRGAESAILMLAPSGG